MASSSTGSFQNGEDRHFHGLDAAMLPNITDPAERADIEETLIEEDAEMMPKDPESTIFSFRTFMVYAGPGWLMSLAYLDPGNLESDLQSGAYTGYDLIWVLFLCTLAGLVLQVLAARLGTVTGLNLAQQCRHGYSRSTSLTIWIMTELAIIGSDMQEVVGSAIALKTLFGWPLWVGTLFTGCDTFTFMAVHHFGKRLLELFIFALVMLMMVCFFSNFAFSPPTAEELLSGFKFSCPPFAVVQLVGTVGAVIMPHNIYLHSALVQSRMVNRQDPVHVRQANKYNVADASTALLISFFINAALLASFANGFFAPICAEDEGGPFACVPGNEATGSVACKTHGGISGTCSEIGLQAGGDALGAMLKHRGQIGRTLFALGVLAAGQASTMTGTFAGQYVMEGFVNLKVPIWLRTLVTRSIALGPAVIVAVLTSDHPDLNSTVSQWLNILQSVQLPFALLPVLHFTSDPNVMGRFVLSPVWQAVCWLLALIVIGVNIYLIIDQVSDKGAGAWVAAAIFFILYLAFIVVIIREDLKRFSKLCARRARSPDLSVAEGQNDISVATQQEITSPTPTGGEGNSSKDVATEG
mmetsp:Transcript_83074/g.173902  ORF Transcript_83074/g.173902 Transcript_83074/m.173902 type:complete len:583 (+) Transcript_83074:312-2060(+)|eukprot:CAMPEP_0206432078 /NCGR_PEP_ID=MMETSP0324_2-20121206/7715_1 /ASSEMBLY_ACC=CAM_ASM_000836 /TAXON_ID=2866 /ORGANISM="Crypthecodinium cohnii, Strain Seligo" /LENGTH=582 /DNA_ID=CAMNT_0053898067 /DNA_START=236 /DNA_END=1984 /DNA_ORIENTATION=-